MEQDLRVCSAQSSASDTIEWKFMGAEMVSADKSVGAEFERGPNLQVARGLSWRNSFAFLDCHL